jgi:hypothetical protein
VIAYRAHSRRSRELAQYLGRLLAAERRGRGTRKHSRALTCFWQAVLGLRWFRENAEPSALARDHGISRATAYRYLDEVIQVLACQAPQLYEALEPAGEHVLAALYAPATRGRPWPTAATTARASGYTPPSNTPQTASPWMPTTAPTTPAPRPALPR